MENNTTQKKTNIYQFSPTYMNNNKFSISYSGGSFSNKPTYKLIKSAHKSNKGNGNDHYYMDEKFKFTNRNKRLHESDDNNNNNNCSKYIKRLDNDNEINNNIVINVFCQLFFCSLKGKGLLIPMISYLDDRSNSSLLCSCKHISNFSHQIPFRGIVNILSSSLDEMKEHHLKRISKFSVCLSDLNYFSLSSIFGRIDRNQIKTLVLKVDNPSFDGQSQSFKDLLSHICDHKDSISELQLIEVCIPIYDLLRLMFNQIEFCNLKSVKIHYDTHQFYKKSKESIENFFFTIAVRKVLMNLETLHIFNDCSPYSTDFHHTFFDLLKNCAVNLTSLKLCSTRYHDEDLIDFLKVNTQLRYLDISDMNCTNEAQIKYLTETLQSFPHLKYLNISGCFRILANTYYTLFKKRDKQYSTILCEFISTIINKIKSLETFICNNNVFNHIRISAIAESLGCNKNLREVSFSNCFLRKMDINILLKALKSNDHLCVLDVTHNRFVLTEPSIKGPLKKLLNKNGTLKYLYLDPIHAKCYSSHEETYEIRIQNDKMSLLKSLEKVIHSRKKKCFIALFKNHNIIE